MSIYSDVKPHKFVHPAVRSLSLQTGMLMCGGWLVIDFTAFLSLLLLIPTQDLLTVVKSTGIQPQSKKVSICGAVFFLR